MWSLDGWDKLKEYDIYVYSGMDTFSRRLLWLHAFTSNRDPYIVAKYYFKFISSEKGNKRSSKYFSRYLLVLCLIASVFWSISTKCRLHLNEIRCVERKKSQNFVRATFFGLVRFCKNWLNWKTNESDALFSDTLQNTNWLWSWSHSYCSVPNLFKT